MHQAQAGTARKVTGCAEAGAARAAVWVEPRLWCEVQYASFTNTGTLREPVFLRMRPDLADN